MFIYPSIYLHTFIFFYQLNLLSIFLFYLFTHTLYIISTFYLHKFKHKFQLY